MDNAEAHRFAREGGTSRPVFRTVRGVTIPYMKLLYALKIEGAEKIPEEGPVIVAPNHKSFWDRREAQAPLSLPPGTVRKLTGNDGTPELRGIR